jgi:hypothetical protein
LAIVHHLNVLPRIHQRQKTQDKGT